MEVNWSCLYKYLGESFSLTGKSRPISPGYLYRFHQFKVCIYPRDAQRVRSKEAMKEAREGVGSSTDARPPLMAAACWLKQ